MVHLTSPNNLLDRTTRSLTFKPFEAKFSLSWVMLAKGGGKLVKASSAIDTLPSLCPVGTS